MRVGATATRPAATGLAAGRERSVPRGVRVRYPLLLAYLAPIDLVPDCVPGLGYADDAIAVARVLRSVVGHAEGNPSTRTPGSPDGQAVVH